MAITTATSARTVNSTTSAITLPASVATGDLLIGICGLDVGAGASTSSPTFTELKDETGTDVWAWIGYLKSPAGGETAVTLTHAAERDNAIGIRIPAAEWHGTTAPEITAVGDGTSANPDPPSISPSWGAEAGTTFIAVAIMDDSAGASTASAWPTNYTLNQVTSNTATSAASVHIAIRITSSATEDPGTWTVSPSEHWRTYTIAVRGAVAGGNTIVPTAGSLTTSTSAPVLRTVTAPANATLTLTGQVPAILQGLNLIPAAASLTLTTSAPVLRTTLAPTPATLTLTGRVPVLATTLAPANATLTLSGQVPVLRAGLNIVPAAAGLTLTGFVPVLVITGGGVTLVPPRALLTLTGQVPLIVVATPTSGGFGPFGGVRYGRPAGLSLGATAPVGKVRSH